MVRWKHEGSGQVVIADEKPAGAWKQVCANDDNKEADPTGKSPKEPGAKLDAGKAPVRQGVLEYFPRALIAVAEVSAFGAEKYTWGGWGPVEDGINRYGNAQERHVLKAMIEGPVDQDSGLLHAAHEAWNALARLELILRAQT